MNMKLVLCLILVMGFVVGSVGAWDVTENIGTIYSGVETGIDTGEYHSVTSYELSYKVDYTYTGASDKISVGGYAWSMGKYSGSQVYDDLTGIYGGPTVYVNGTYTWGASGTSGLNTDVIVVYWDGTTVYVYCDGSLRGQTAMSFPLDVRYYFSKDNMGDPTPIQCSIYDVVFKYNINREIDLIVSPTAAYTYSTISASDNSGGFTDGIDIYTIDWDDGTTTEGNYQYGMHKYHYYEDAGTYNITYTITQDGDTYTDYQEVTIEEESTCDYDVSLSVSKSNLIEPVTEYINASISLSGNYELITGSTIGYYIGAGSGGTINPVAVATFTNTTGGWYYNRNDLGSTSNGYTTYDDIFSELIRFPDSGNYIVRVAIMPYSSCSKYDEEYVYVNPSSQVNLDIYFKDGITYNMIPSVTSAISIVNVTGNTTYSGNPIGIATQIGQNVSIYATAEGYTPKHIYYTIPSSVYGNTLDIPFFMFPTDYGEYYPDNTTWTITVKSLTSGENLYGASVCASDSTGTIDDGYTNSDGYVTLFVPFRDSLVRLDVARVPYISSSQWVNLGNATEYATTVYLNYGGTPTPTPSYNYTFTPTITPIPSVTTVEQRFTNVNAYDSAIGSFGSISGATVSFYDGSETEYMYKGALRFTATTGTDGWTGKLPVEVGHTYFITVTKNGYYDQFTRHKAPDYDTTIYAPMTQKQPGVTVATTQPTLVLPTPGGTGIQGGFIGWILDYFSEWFGVDNGTARILLALFIIMCSSVFVGGSLAGFGSGAGAGMGALIGGMFAFIAMCYVQFLPFWLLPIGIAFVGMAFFVWNMQEK